MKKFIQYTAVLGAVLTVLGFGTASAAHVQGGRWSRMQIWRGNHHWREHFVYSMPVGADRGTKLDENRRSFPCISELSLEVDYGDVTICPSDSDQIIVSCGSNNDFNQVVWVYEEDDEVKLAVYGKRTENRKPEVTVTVPLTFSFQEIDVELTSGNCTFEGMKAREFSGETAGGVLVVEGGEASQVDLSCAAGEIDYYGQAAGDVDIDCAAGSVIYNGVIRGDVEVDCAAGNVFLELPGQQEMDFNYEIDGTGGSIQVGGKSYSGVLFEKKHHHEAPRTMELQTAAGTIEVVFEHREVLPNEAEKMPSAEIGTGDSFDGPDSSAEKDAVVEVEE